MAAFVEIASDSLNDRAQYLSYGIDPASDAGLEIGALNWPLFSPKDTNVKFVDYAPTEVLKRISYSSDPDRIVDVDYIWNGSGSLTDIVGQRECFDYVIASHVIEHIPNVLGWLRGLFDVLKPGGRLNLAVPDRRFTFDLERRETTLAQWIEADLLNYTRPSPGQVFDHVSQVRHIRATEMWQSSKLVHEFGKMAGPDAPRHALEQARVVASTDQYIDTHCSVFTPMSFVDLFAEATKIGLIGFYIDRFFATGSGAVTGFEFYVNLLKPDRHSEQQVIDQAAATRRRLAMLYAQQTMVGAPLSADSLKFASFISQSEDNNRIEDGEVNDPPAGFIEADYLDANPDVGDAVRGGAIDSGLRHWIRFGKREGRPWSRPRER